MRKWLSAPYQPALWSSKRFTSPRRHLFRRVFFLHWVLLKRSSLCRYLSDCLCLSVCLSVCLPVSSTVCMSACLLMYLFLSLPACLCLSACLCVLSACLSVSLSSCFSLTEPTGIGTACSILMQQQQQTKKNKTKTKTQTNKQTNKHITVFLFGLFSCLLKILTTTTTINKEKQNKTKTNQPTKQQTNKHNNFYLWILVLFVKKSPLEYHENTTVTSTTILCPFEECLADGIKYITRSNTAFSALHW